MAKFFAVLLLVAATAYVDAKQRPTVAPLEQRGPANYGPYPQKPYGKQPLYFQQINEGRYDQNLTYDVSFATSNDDFGILGQKDDKLFQHNPKVLKLNIIREACPPNFVQYFLRKANQLRSRHQAGKLVLSANLTTEGQVELSSRVLSPESKVGFINSGTVSRYRFFSKSNGVTDVLVNAEHMAEHFYLWGVKNYHNYGKAAKSYDAQLYHNFAALIWQSTKEVGVSCVTIQNGIGGPYNNQVTNEVLVKVVYGHKQTGNGFADNVLPPGYFDFDVKFIGTEEQTKQEQKIIKKSFADIAAGK